MSMPHEAEAWQESHVGQRGDNPDSHPANFKG
jgi:hypothetical protein